MFDKNVLKWSFNEYFPIIMYLTFYPKSQNMPVSQIPMSFKIFACRFGYENYVVFTENLTLRKQFCLGRMVSCQQCQKVSRMNQYRYFVYKKFHPLKKCFKKSSQKTESLIYTYTVPSK